MTNVADILGTHAARAPDSPAVIEPGGTYSYREFDRAVWRAAAWLVQAGVRPGDVVGVRLGTRALHLVVIYALARMGAVQLPLPLREPAAILQALAQRFGLKAIVVGDASNALPGIRALEAQDAWLQVGQAPDRAPLPVEEAQVRSAGGDAGWKIVLTSGTTGTPKAILQTHAMHLAWRELCQGAIPLVPADRYPVIVPLDFHTSFLRCASCFHAGATIFVGHNFPKAADLADFVARQAVTYLWLPPAYVPALLAIARGKRPLFPGLRYFRTGTMTVAPRIRRQILRRLTPNLLVGYGSNDGTSPATTAFGAILERFPDSLGVPAPGVTLEIVDDEDRALPAGAVGWVRLRAPGMPGAYIDDAPASERAYRHGWFHPGDLGALSAEGVLYFKGRSDERMNYDGLKIYPVEIESVLLEHPAVAEAAAFALPSEAHQDVPAAAVVLTRAVSAKALVRWCRKRLGKRAPHSILVLEALPRNAMRKVLKRELVALAARKG